MEDLPCALIKILKSSESLYGKTPSTFLRKTSEKPPEKSTAASLPNPVKKCYLKIFSKREFYETSNPLGQRMSLSL